MKGQTLLRTLLACLFLLPGIAMAQVTASVSGTVQDTSGAVIPAAAVTVKNLETGAARTVATDDRGYYRALSLPVGRYEVGVEKAGFKRQVRTGINLVVGQEAVVNLSLEVGEVQQAVTVTAEAAIVNTTTATTAGLVGEQQVKDLPLNGRSFDNLITLNPGTNNTTAMKPTGSGGAGAEFNIAGRRGTENIFMLNGIELTGSAVNGSEPGGASGNLLGIDAVREFNVQANTYGAQYGKRFGGQINIVTMSGTNQFHGTMFEFLRNSALDARNFFDPQRAAFRRNDFGASAGGPIRKDRTFIFGNYEGYRQSLTTINVPFVPNNASRATAVPGMVPYLAIYPVATVDIGGGIGEAFVPAVNPVREDYGTLRLDQVFSEKDWMSGAYTIDDGFNVLPSVNPYSGEIKTTRAQVLSLDENHTFSPSIINTARIGYSRAVYYADQRALISLPPSLSLIAGQTMGSVVVGGGGVNLGAINNFGGLISDQFMVRNLFTYTDSVQIIRGKHLINVGAWLQRVQMNDLFVGSGHGQVTFADLPSLLAGKASQLTGTPPIPRKYSRQWEGAWYVDDTIKLRSNLTFNLGVRHEFTNGWNVKPLGPANYLLGTTGCSAGVSQCIQTQPIVSTSMFTDNNAKRLFGPRVGLAWDPFGKGKTSIHAGYGMYYNLLDDFTYVIPQPASFQISNVQFPYQVVPGNSYPGAVPRPYGFVPSDAKTPTLQEWSFTVEQQITASTALSVGYVGSHAYHLMGSADVNPTQSVICPASPCPATLPAGTKYYPSSAQSTKLNPALGSWAGFASFGNSSYNSLQIDVKQRLTKGLTFRANYAFSKALDDGSTVVGGFFTNCPSATMDALNPIRDYGLACYDIKHRFAFSGSYELPIGQGKSLLSGAGGAANKLLGGWRLNGIVSAQDGLPFTPIVGFGNSRNGGTGSNERPSWNPNFSGPIILGTVDKWFNPNAFILPPAGTYGNMGRNVLRGPGLTEIDMSLFKDTRITERVNLQFRAEFFNIINHANFGEPSATIFSSGNCSVAAGTCPTGVGDKSPGALVGSAGVINTLLNPGRQIQFGLKLIW